MNWQKLNDFMIWPLLISALLFSVGCCSAKTAQRYTVARPKLEPLPAATLQAMQPDSTELLKKAEDWYESSGQLLDSVTSN